MAKLDENGLLYLWQRFKTIFVTKDELSNFGAGDMMKATYDTDNNGRVDDADKLGGQLPSYYAKAVDLNSYVSTSIVGQANGVASLGADGKVPKAQLPETAPAEHTHEMGDIAGLEQSAAEMTAALAKKADTAALEEAVEDMAEIARGKCASYVFNTVDELDTWLANPTNTENLRTGDVFYIRAVDVPDYWWDKETGTKQILETTKVDLSVITNAEIDEILAT